MCGFVGISDSHKYTEEEIKNAISLIRYRGPDGTRIKKYPEKNFTLSFCRLAIQDISESAMQPFHSEKKNIIVFNGEIYNFKYLREELIRENYNIITKSDTEVLLAGYEKWGLKKLLFKIRGMYAFAIYDQKENKFLIARDHFGIKPFYYSLTSNFIFASEIKSIISLMNDNDWDSEGATLSLFTGRSQRGKTPYKDICELKPGHYGTYDMNKKSLNIEKFFDAKSLVNESDYNYINRLNANEITNYFNEILNKSVNSHMVSDVPVGSCFSAGLDSSLISAIASKANNKNKINLFCYIVEKDKSIMEKCSEEFIKEFGNNIFYDSENSNSNSVEDLVKNLYYSEFPGKIEATALSSICNLAFKNKHKVLLAGDAADEIFGGYHFHLNFLTRSLFSSGKINFFLKLCNSLLPYNFYETSYVNPENTDYFYQPSHLELFEMPINFLLNRDNRLKEWEENKRAYDFIENKNHRNTQAFLLDGLNHKLSKYLHRSDSYGMRNSVEIRVPFLDEDFVKASLNLSLEKKMEVSFLKRKVETKKILKLLAKINKVPSSIINRKKVGTKINTKNFINNICSKIKFEHCASILKLNDDHIKYNLMNSKSPTSDYFQYHFLSTEILGKLFIEKKSISAIVDDIQY
tara:strand:+ start:302 stop:2206 length:1905 start_codon:yes stop_codon:yes gene_type:complete